MRRISNVGTDGKYQFTSSILDKIYIIKIFPVSQTLPSTCTENKGKLNSPYMGFPIVCSFFFFLLFIYHQLLVSIEPKKKRTGKSDIDQYQNFLYPSSLLCMCPPRVLSFQQRLLWCLCPAPTAVSLYSATDRTDCSKWTVHACREYTCMDV